MSNHTPVHVDVQKLFESFLKRQTEAHGEGTAAEYPEVLPYEAGPVQPVDPKLALDEVRSVLATYRLESGDLRSAPPHWASVVSQHEPVVSLPIAAGNFPQLVRNFHAFLQRPASAAERPSGRAIAADSLAQWTEKALRNGNFLATFAGIGTLRLARQWEELDRLIPLVDGAIPDELRDAWTNEKGATEWHRGELESARSIWQNAGDHPAARFNRGMADLFLGNADAGRTEMEKALEALPTESAWTFLGRLYLTLGR